MMVRMRNNFQSIYPLIIAIFLLAATSACRTNNDLDQNQPESQSTTPEGQSSQEDSSSQELGIEKLFSINSRTCRDIDFLGFSPDGNYLLSSKYSDGKDSLSILRVSDCVEEFRLEFSEEQSRGENLLSAMSPDSNRVAIALDNIYIFSFPDGDLQLEADYYGSGISDIGFSATGRWIAYSVPYGEGTILIDAMTGNPLMGFDESVSPNNFFIDQAEASIAITYFSIDRASETLLDFVIYNLGNGLPISRLAQGSGEEHEYYNGVFSDDLSIVALSWRKPYTENELNTILETAEAEETDPDELAWEGLWGVEVFNVEEGILIHAIDRPSGLYNGYISDLAISDNLEYLAIADLSGVVSVYDLGTGYIVNEMSHNHQRIDYLEWKPDSLQLAVNWSKKLTIYDFE